MSPEKKIINIPEAVVIKDLAQRLNISVGQVLAELLKNGITLGMNESIDFETAAIIADDFGFQTELEKVKEETASDLIELNRKLQQEKRGLKPRPPVVVVMGHVDHGKTKLLDAIRKTNVMAGEAGGITQHIGAYQVKKSNRLITFIDTPGHEAFTAMRSRGANVADIAILVVAADEGVQPQTKESIEIIKKTGLALIVAINKIDKPGAEVDKVKSQLSELGLIPEDWGGQTIFTLVSAKAGQGIDGLLEMILLIADLESKKLMANPERPALGTIIESDIDPGEGPVATVLIQAGTLKIGDTVLVGNTFGRVKALKDYLGENTVSAGPSTPSRILGLKGLPLVGEILEATEVGKAMRKNLKKKMPKRGVKIGQSKSKVSTIKNKESEKTEDQIKKKTLKLVIRADTLGSLEAILSSLEKIKHEEVGWEIVYKSLGNITEKDVILADNTTALLIGFNVEPTTAAQEVAKGREKEIFYYKIIYELIDKICEELEKLLSIKVSQEVIGHLKVLAIFRTEATSMIIGGQVTDGRVTNGCDFNIRRQQQQIGKGRITQLQQNKKDIKEITKGNECGIRYKGDPVAAVGDNLEFYQSHQEKRKLFNAE